MTADFLRFVAAFVFAAALFVADWRADALDPVRAALSVTLAPFRATAAAPRAISEAAADYLRARATLAEEKRAREEEFRGLSARLQSLDFLTAQNSRLRALLRLREITDGDFAAAEIMAGARQSFTGLVVIDRGAQGGARAGAGVIDVGGVFGQVVQVDADTSLIRQVTDINHQVAARCRRNGLFAVLRGDGGDGIEAQFCPPTPMSARAMCLSPRRGRIRSAIRSPKSNRRAPRAIICALSRARCRGWRPTRRC